MKTNQVLGICGVAVALCLGAGTLSAQTSNTNGGGQGGRGNFDPAQFQQRMMDNIRRDVGFGGRGFGGVGRRGGNGAGGGTNNNAQGGRGGGFGGQPSPEADALQKTLDDNAPTAQVKVALEKYRAARKAKEAKLAQAQEDLRKVLTPRQEAQAALLGLLN